MMNEYTAELDRLIQLFDNAATKLLDKVKNNC